MRTKITASGNDVTVERDCPYTGKRISTTYFAPYTASGRPGYVRIRDAAGRYPQVCEMLASSGNTLEATPDDLLSVIRREYRRALAAERREAMRWK